jgi:deoxyribodipyrimidine photo-lyase
MNNIGVVWFRNDLRLHDNEALVNATKSADGILPVYVFDERIFLGKTSYGMPKTGRNRAKFIIESVTNLRKNLKARGSDLYVRVGIPEDEINEIANNVKASWVFCNREMTDEEIKVQDRLEKKLWTMGREIYYSRGKMLYYTADLPFPVTHTPDVFTTFRKEVEKFVPVRHPLDVPDDLKVIYSSDLPLGDIPTLEDLGFHEEDQGYIETKFVGGEDNALKQLDYYIHSKKLLANYKETRNELLGWDFSSKFSPWLSVGALSPKTVYDSIKRFEKEVTSNDSTYWLYFELLWRDYFRLVGKKYGNDIFKEHGINGQAGKEKSYDISLFELWKFGKTGIPFIDANMRELNATGYMSNRGRQNVASFLVNDLKLPWLMGAEYFESMLLDYDPCSNYGNWCYIAGVGNDPRENRYFNILGQARRYDSEGEYVKYWLPKLKMVPSNLIHQVDQLTIQEQAKYKVILGKDYPNSCINSSRWIS